jgi:hypothetical protein
MKPRLILVILENSTFKTKECFTPYFLSPTAQEEKKLAPDLKAPSTVTAGHPPSLKEQ